MKEIQQALISWPSLLNSPTFTVRCSQCGVVLTRLTKLDFMEKIERANQLHDCKTCNTTQCIPHDIINGRCTKCHRWFGGCQ